jgi:predicted nuclease of predicted toxin-antitoxin system
MPHDKLKFLIDIGVSKKLEEWLRVSGYDIKAMRDIDPKAEDTKILSVAVSESRMVVTMDKDFGELVFKSGKAHAGVLILRLEDATGHEKIEVMKAILRDHEDKLYGKFCVFHSGRLRVAG